MGPPRRAISERAGVTAPSLYRFFADRDEILDALLEAMLQDLDAHGGRGRGALRGGSVDEFLRLELDLHVALLRAAPEPRATVVRRPRLAGRGGARPGAQPRARASRRSGF